jgi:hypothetical protein
MKTPKVPSMEGLGWVIHKKMFSFDFTMITEFLLELWNLFTTHLYTPPGRRLMV